jgi:hypothetical protein
MLLLLAMASPWPPGRHRRHGRPPVAGVAAAVVAGAACRCPLVAAVPHHRVHHGRAGVGLVVARIWEKMIGEDGQGGDWGRERRDGLGEAAGGAMRQSSARRRPARKEQATN